MRTVKTFRKLGQDEEGHSTSFETHKYPGGLGTGQLTLAWVWREQGREGGDQGSSSSSLLCPATCLWDTEGCLGADVLGGPGSTLFSLQLSCTTLPAQPLPCSQPWSREAAEPRLRLCPLVWASILAL